MDPLSILSVAAAAIQFLDFGSRVLTDTREAYASSLGQSHNNLELSKISEDFTSLTEDAIFKLNDHELIYSERNKHITRNYRAKTQDLLFQFCREASNINEELQQLLAKLRARGTTKLELAANSLFVALKGILSAEKIQKLKDRIDQTRQQIMTAMLAMSWCQAERNGISMLELAEKQAKLIAQLGTIDETTRKLGDDMKELSQGRSPKDQSQPGEPTPHAPPSSTGTPSATYRNISNRKAIRHNKDLAEAIIESLSFERINSRQESIPKAHADTYEWVFGEPRCGDNGEPLWSDFSKWLTSESDHVPGAGKSTLFKFLTRDERLWASLREWASPSNLILATYFSWNAGNSFQKSRQGLLRTLLGQCLERYPSLLVPVVFPGRWAMLQLHNDKVTLPDWTMVELEAGLQAMLSQAGRQLSGNGTSFKFGLFIDGLDEFEDDHLQLIELVREANAHPNVKICVSSRPWNVFRDVFSQNPMLQLELLTQNDIRLYVDGLFQKSQGFKERSLLQPDEAKELLEVLVIKAQGVFLWVSVVVRDLLLSLQEGDKLSDLQTTLNALPEDLSDLYQVIWKRTNSRYYGEAAQYFSLVEAYAKHSLTPSSVAIWMGEEEPSLDADIKERNKDFLCSAASSLSRRLNSRTRGLLDTYEWNDLPNGRVDYMHRTASDWVHENWDSVFSLLEPDFDVTLVLLKGEILRIGVDNSLIQGFQPEIFWRHLIKLLHIAATLESRPSTNASIVRILDTLHDQVARLYDIKDQRGRSILSNDIHLLSKMKTFQSNPQKFAPGSSMQLYDAPKLQPNGAVDWTAWSHISFLGLIAQVPVVSYIESKVSQEPKLARTEGQAVPLLVNAVVGGVPDDLLRYSISGGWDYIPSRLGLVRFLLPYVSHRDIEITLDFVRFRKRTMATTTLQYLCDVEEILTSHIHDDISYYSARVWTKTTETRSQSTVTEATKKKPKVSLIQRLRKIAGLKH
ncbi:hypothetical protein F5B20DRAFT_588842 [Whalleya microplaca]|nr:hypothetical protein F5B20DRAFT_588842 [Whalleya microplaca]